MAKRVMIFLIIATIAVLGLSGNLFSSVLTEIFSVYHYVLSTDEQEDNEKAIDTYQVDATTAATREVTTLKDSEEETYAGDYDVVVIGAGGGGLSAAATLSLGGMKVLVIEQHSKVGGYMTNFTRGDYTFEVSLHNTGGLNKDTGVSYHLFETLDIIDRVKPLYLKTAYNAAYPDAIYTIPGDPDEYQEYLIAIFPQEEAGIKEFFKTTRCIETFVLIYNAILEKKPLKAFSAWFENPLFMLTFIKYSSSSAMEMLNDFLQDEKLKAVISWLAGYTGASLEETPAMALLGMFGGCHYGGFYHFEGGSQSVANALADVIEDNGGVIKLSTMATKIKIEDGKAVAVKTSDGSLYNCNYVVSNANALDTFNKMVGREYLSEEFLEQLDSMKAGGSPFVIYLGVNKEYTDKFNGAHIISVSPYYITPSEYDPDSEETLETAGYTLLNYSVIDSTVAPAGKNVIAILPWFDAGDYRESWYEDDSKYKQLKEEVAQIIIERAETYLPGLSDYIEVMEVATPRTFEHYTFNTNGAVMGWEISLDTALERLPQQTPIENLLLAGHWTTVGSQDAVLRSGLNAGNKILEMNKKE